MPHVNFIAVVVAAVVIFILSGLWYSPILFSKRWVRLIGKTEEELRAGQSVLAPRCGGRRRLLARVRGFNLASFVIAGLILGAWH